MIFNITITIFSFVLLVYGINNLITINKQSASEGLSANNNVNSMEHPEGKQVYWSGEWISLDEARSKGLDTSNLNGGGDAPIYVINGGQGGLKEEK